MAEANAEPPKGAVVPEAHEVQTHDPPKAFFTKGSGKTHLKDFKEYEELYNESIREPDKFWGRLARELLTWDRDFQTVHSGTLENGDNAWFLEGRLNASYNCVDRHAIKNPNKPAIIYEADEPGEGRTITYGELLREVSKLAYVLKSIGVRKGDTVAVYLPMIPEALIALLAITRIGAVHSVVFAGFSSGSLSDRVLDANSKVVITSDEGKRGGKVIGTKKIVDEGLKKCPDVTNVIVFRRTGADVPWTKGRDLWWHEEVEKHPAYLPPEPMASEDPLFLLYTSGSTGKPKGVMHATAGYLVGAAATGKYVFDIHDDDIYFCGGDVGWITGHTYVVYAPLLLGVATVVFEGTPAYPSFSRYWDVIEKHNVSQFYVAPTALRLLKRAGDEHVHHKMPKLRVLGSVGEPIAAEVWKWYYDVVGKGEAHLVDTYWQTETGSHVITPLAGITPTKPGSASLPFFGIEPALVDPNSGEEIQGNDVEGVLAFKQAWPSMARTVWGAHKRYMDTYLNVYKGYYFTGDGAARDHDGFYWIRGRVDDVVNVSGHRLSTAEIEAALIEHDGVAEAAVVGINDDLTGQAVNAFVSLKPGADSGEGMRKDLILQVRKSIGPFAAPKVVYIVDDLPKTRSGKIMRRILRKIVSGEADSLGDITTLSDPSVVEQIIDTVNSKKKRASFLPLFIRARLPFIYIAQLAAIARRRRASTPAAMAFGGSGGFTFGSGSNSNASTTFGGFGSTNNNASNTGNSAGFGSTSTGGGFGSSTTQNNPFGSSTFGSGSGGFGSNTTTNNSSSLFGNKPTTGNLFGSNTTTTSGGGLFGSTNNASSTPAFGSSSGGAFGTASTSNPFGGGASGGSTTFGGFNSQSKPAFGSSTSTTPLFGQGGTGTTGGFSSGFGTSGSGTALTNQPIPPSQGTLDPQFSAVVDKPANSSQSESFQSITMMNAYNKYSFEELRLADYNAGRRFGNGQTGGAGAFGSSTFGGFGQTNTTGGFGTPSTGTNLFGSTSNSGGFGGNTSTAFGSGSGSGGLFGNKTGGLFGQQTSGTSSGGLFGTSNNQTASSNPFGSGTFGSTNSTASTGGLFGNNQSQQKPSLFGNTNTTSNTGTGFSFGNNSNNATASTGGGLFGNNANQQQSGGGLFGNNQNQQKPSLFGASTTGGFGTSNTQGQSSGGLFGTSNTTNTGGGLFGNTSNTNTGSGLFGNNNQQSNTGGGGLFGAGANNTANKPGGLFGGSTLGNNQQQSSGGLFGNTSTQQSGGLFGNTNNNASGGLSFGNTNQQKPGGSLFNTGNSNQSGGLFGSSTNNSSFFGGSQHSSLLDPNPYGQSSIWTGLPQPNLDNSKPLVTPLVATQQMKESQAKPPPSLRLNQSRYMTPPRKNGFGFSYSTYGTPNSVASTPGGNGLTNSMYGSRFTGGSFGRSMGKAASVSSLRSQYLEGESVLSPGAFTPSTARYSSGSIRRLTIDKTIRNDLFTRPPLPPLLGDKAATNAAASSARPKQLTIQDESPSEAPGKLKKRVSFDKGLTGGINRTLNGETGALVRTTPEEDDDDATVDGSRPAPPTANGPHKGNELAIVPEDRETETVSTKKRATRQSPEDPQPGDYWMKPTRAELRQIPRERLSKFRNFEVGRVGAGKVVFNEPVDLTKLPLDDLFEHLIEIRVRSVTVYPDGVKKPKAGEGLNVPSTISIENSWPRNRSGASSVTSGPAFEKHVQRLKRIPGTTFVSYDAETGVWTFKVPHYTRYVVSEDDEASDDDMNMAGSYPAPAGPALNFDSPNQPILKPGGAPGTPGRPLLDFEGDWAEQLQRTISPRKQNRDALREAQSKVLLDHAYEPIKPNVRKNEFRSSIDVMNAIFGNERGSRAGQREAEPDLEFPYPKRVKSCDQNAQEMTDEDKAWHASFKPNFTTRGQLVCKTTQAPNAVGWTSEALAAADSELISINSLKDNARKLDLASLMSNASISLSHGVPKIEYAHLPFSLLKQELPSAEQHESLGNVYELLHVLFDVYDDEFSLDLSGQQRLDFEPRIRKDRLSKFLATVVASHTYPLTYVNDPAGAAFQHLTAHNVQAACETLGKAKDFNLALLVAQIESADASFQQDMAEQIVAWKEQDIIAEMTEEIRSLYELFSGNTTTCQGKQDGPAENRASTFLISEKYDLDWLQAFALCLWYGKAKNGNVEDVVEDFEQKISRGEESASPVSADGKEDPLWVALKLFASSRKTTAAPTPTLPTDIDSLSKPFDVSRTFTLFQAITRGLHHVQPRRDPVAADRLAADFAFELEAKGDFVAALWALAHICHDTTRGEMMVDLLCRHAEKEDLNVPTDKATEPSQQWLTLTETLQIPEAWIYQAKALYSRSINSRFEELHFLIQAEEWNEAHACFCGRVAGRLVIDQDYKSLGAIIVAFGEKPEEKVEGWLRGGSMYADFATVVSSRHVGSPAYKATLRRLRSTLADARSRLALNGTDISAGGLEALEERVGVREMSGVVAELLEKDGMGGKEVLSLPLGEGEMKKAGKVMAREYYAKVMGGVR
ncbi:hypothetical protein DV737_g4935, partial [Chaetothyriales sp. CBS 132003]